MLHATRDAQRRGLPATVRGPSEREHATATAHDMANRMRRCNQLAAHSAGATGVVPRSRYRNRRRRARCAPAPLRSSLCSYAGREGGESPRSAPSARAAAYSRGASWSTTRHPVSRSSHAMHPRHARPPMCDEGSRSRCIPDPRAWPVCPASSAWTRGRARALASSASWRRSSPPWRGRSA